MPRSPKSLRPRVRNADKITLSPSSASPPPTTMATASAPVDIELLIKKSLTSDDIADTLVNKLVDRLKEAVVSALTDRLVKAEEEIANLKREVDYLKTNCSQVDSKARVRCDDLEQYTRRHNVRVFGIPEVAGESTDLLVADLFKQKLKVDVPIERLDRTHRVGRELAPAEDGTPRWRPIIVRFGSYRDRRSVFNSKRLLKGTNVTIREDLTALRMDVFRAAAKRFGPKNTWTQDGRILWLDANGKKGMATHMDELPR